MSIETELCKRIDIEKVYARDIMIPRGLITYINYLDTKPSDCNKIIEKFTNSTYKFILVCNKTLNTDAKLGVCSLENICEQLITKTDKINLIDSRLKLAFFVENQTFSEVIQVINNSTTPVGVVVDKIGEICGFISKESIVNFFASFNISGSESIHRFSNIIPKNIFNNVKSETIGGFVMEYLDKIPKEGDNFIVNNYQFTIVEMNKNTIKSIAVTTLDSKKR